MVLLFSKFPVGHDIPYDAVLVDRAFLELSIFVVDNFEECKELRRDSVGVDAQFFEYFFFDIAECFVRLSLD